MQQDLQQQQQMQQHNKCNNTTNPNRRSDLGSEASKKRVNVKSSERNRDVTVVNNRFYWRMFCKTARDWSMNKIFPRARKTAHFVEQTRGKGQEKQRSNSSKRAIDSKNSKKNSIFSPRGKNRWASAIF